MAEQASPKTELPNASAALDAVNPASATPAPNPQDEQHFRPVPLIKSLFTLRFADMTITQRVSLGFMLTLIIFFAAVVSVVSILKSQTAARAEFISQLHEVQKLTTDISDALIDSQRRLLALTAGNPGELRSPEYDPALITPRLERARQAIARLDSDISTALAREILPRLESQVASYQKTLQAIKDESPGAPPVSLALREQALPALATLRELQHQVLSSGLRDTDSAREIIEYTQYQLYGALLVAAIAVLLVLFFINHSLKRDLARVGRSLRALSGGNLQREARAHRRNEIGNLETLLDQLAQSTSNTLYHIRYDAGRLRDIVASNNQRLDETMGSASSQKEKAATVAAATAAMESAIDKVTEFAKQTLEEVQGAESASNTCRCTMQDNITTTHALSERLRKTSEAVTRINAMGDEIKEIVNTIVGDGCEISGAARLSDCTIMSSDEANVFIGTGVICENSIIVEPPLIIEFSQITPVPIVMGLLVALLIVQLLMREAPLMWLPSPITASVISLVLMIVTLLPIVQQSTFLDCINLSTSLVIAFWKAVLFCSFTMRAASWLLRPSKSSRLPFPTSLSTEMRLP